MTPLERLSAAAKRAAVSRRQLEFGNRNRLTARQAEILCFIEEFWRENNRSPALKEIQTAFDYANHGGYVRILASLQRRGFIVRGVIPTSRMKQSHEISTPTALSQSAETEPDIPTQAYA